MTRGQLQARDKTGREGHMHKHPKTGQFMRGLRVVVALGAALVMAGCVALEQNHGYVPSEDDLAQVIVGVDTKDTVSDVVGRPSAEGLLASSGWYYVRSQFKTFGALAPQEVDRQVVAITFDDAGTVANIERFGLEQGNVVVLTRRVTTSNTSGITFLQQLFGNLGRIDAAGLLQ